MATQESLWTHDVSLAAAVGTIFLLFGVEIVIDTSVTGLVVVDIDPSTSLTVPALLLFGVRWHLYIGCRIGENGMKPVYVYVRPPPYK